VSSQPGALLGLLERWFDGAGAVAVAAVPRVLHALYDVGVCH
jgi:hypothetical protein